MIIMIMVITIMIIIMMMIIIMPFWTARLKKKVLQFLVKSATTFPMTRRHIPCLNLQQNFSANLISH
jgi:hypothetical protein